MGQGNFTATLVSGAPSVRAFLPGFTRHVGQADATSNRKRREPLLIGAKGNARLPGEQLAIPACCLRRVLWSGMEGMLHRVWISHNAQRSPLVLRSSET